MAVAKFTPIKEDSFQIHKRHNIDYFTFRTTAYSHFK